MEEGPSQYKADINSIAHTEISKSNLVKLRDRVNYLDSSLRALEDDQAALQKRISDAAREAERLKLLFESLFEDQIKGIGIEKIGAELFEERLRAPCVPGQVTLGMSEVTREQLLSIMDAIKRVSEECQGPAPKEIVQSRAESIGITKGDFEEILARLRRAGALIESEGTIKLI